MRERQRRLSETYPDRGEPPAPCHGRGLSARYERSWGRLGPIPGIKLPVIMSVNMLVVYAVACPP
jgi:hypothetical protein